MAVDPRATKPPASLAEGRAAAAAAGGDGGDAGEGAGPPAGDDEQKARAERRAPAPACPRPPSRAGRRRAPSPRPWLHRRTPTGRAGRPTPRAPRISLSRGCWTRRSASGTRRSRRAPAAGAAATARTQRGAARCSGRSLCQACAVANESPCAPLRLRSRAGEVSRVEPRRGAAAEPALVQVAADLEGPVPVPAPPQLEAGADARGAEQQRGPAGVLRRRVQRAHAGAAGHARAPAQEGREAAGGGGPGGAAGEAEPSQEAPAGAKKFPAITRASLCAFSRRRFDRMPERGPFLMPVFNSPLLTGSWGPGTVFRLRHGMRELRQGRGVPMSWTSAGVLRRTQMTKKRARVRSKRAAVLPGGFFGSITAGSRSAAAGAFLALMPAAVLRAIGNATRR